MKKVLFIDRDGTIIKEPPTDFQVDSLEKLEFCDRAITSLAMISKLDFELSMVSNQDGRGTVSFPEEDFITPQNKMLKTLEGEGVIFDDIFIDDSFESDNSPNRKPRTGMLNRYFSDEYDLTGSFVIGDRLTDVELAKNLGSKAILFRSPSEGETLLLSRPELKQCTELITDNWNYIYEFLRYGSRRVTVSRKTRETEINLTLDIDGQGQSRVNTGLSFFDHMISQIVHHASFTVDLMVKGDLNVDEHHTIEDTGIVLGEAVRRAIGSKRAMERYGFTLPMDECDAGVVLDFGGRTDFFWDVEFKREKIGDVPTEMFKHFFKSFAESAAVNLHIRGYGENEHHKIEGVFKAFARAMKNAVRRDIFNDKLPTSKGVI